MDCTISKIELRVVVLSTSIWSFLPTVQDPPICKSNLHLSVANNSFYQSVCYVKKLLWSADRHIINALSFIKKLSGLAFKYKLKVNLYRVLSWKEIISDMLLSQTKRAYSCRLSQEDYHIGAARCTTNLGWRLYTLAFFEQYRYSSPATRPAPTGPDMRLKYCKSGLPFNGRQPHYPWITTYLPIEEGWKAELSW